jgi:hypothetical protein
VVRLAAPSWLAWTTFSVQLSLGFALLIFVFRFGPDRLI